jgi:hypothetical protein
MIDPANTRPQFTPPEKDIAVEAWCSDFNSISATSVPQMLHGHRQVVQRMSLQAQVE